MTDPLVRVVDVYPYRVPAEGPVEFLLLKRASNRIYGDSWRMIGGKSQADERAWNAGLRELREETQLQPVRFWTLPSVNTFYEWKEDRLNLAPAFAAELNANPILNDEHVEYVWSDVESACDLLVWPEQQRLIRLTSRLLMHPLAPEWLIPTANPSRI